MQMVDILKDISYWKEMGANGLSRLIAQAHNYELYQAWMTVSSDKDLIKEKLNGYYARIACPVDVEVYDSTGKLAGKVVNNVVDDTITSNVVIIINGDEKHLYFPPYDTYTLKLVGTDGSTMNYTAEAIDIKASTITQQKEFKNVALFAGKAMTSTVGDTIATSTVQLLVTDSKGIPIATINTDGTEIPINQKQYFKLWGKVTSWEKTPLNWFLLIVCFGWIWMAF
jgi:hypothetical protein